MHDDRPRSVGSLRCPEGPCAATYAARNLQEGAADGLVFVDAQHGLAVGEANLFEAPSGSLQ